MKYELDHEEIRDGVRRLCKDFEGAYWRKCDREQAYPVEFVQALTGAGYLGALIPEEYGGSNLPITAAAAILETIHHAGCNAAAAMHKCTPWVLCCVTDHKSKSSVIYPASLTEAYVYRLLVSLNPVVALIRPPCALRPSAMEITML